MRYGYHARSSYYIQYFSPTKTHAFKSQSNYKPICGAYIANIPERRFEQIYVGVGTGLGKNFCQNCLRTLVSRYIKAY